MKTERKLREVVEKRRAYKDLMQINCGAYARRVHRIGWLSVFGQADIEEGDIRSQPKSWKTANGETSISMIPQTPEIARRSNIAKTTNMREGNRRVQLAKRTANATASTAPNRKAKMPRTKNGIGRQTVFGRGEI